MAKFLNIIGITLFFILGSFSLGFSAEEFTITTYYPSPYGSYKELQVGTIKIGDSDENTIKFYGTTNDGPGEYNHTVIAERLYGGADESELLLFKGNDPGSCSGCQDRIRLDTPGYIVFQTGPPVDVFRTYNPSTEGNTRMIITSDGNVGIGTAAPANKLHVLSSVAGDFVGVGITNQNSGWTAGYGSSLSLRGAGAGSEDRDMGKIGAYWSSDWDGGNAYMSFSTRVAEALSEKMRITSTGNVGIGTASPNTTLDVTGTIRSTNAISPASGAGLNMYYSTVSNKGAIFPYDYTSLQYKPLQIAGSELNFLINASEKMRIDSAGNVGIGTASPQAKLDVNGNIYGWNVPSDVKITTATHNGNFGGYKAMKDWIQTNGCEGYHVCDSTELTRWAQAGGTFEGNGCWYNTGVLASDWEGAKSDCQAWTKNDATTKGYFWTQFAWGNAPCSQTLKVYCCK